MATRIAQGRSRLSRDEPPPAGHLKGGRAALARIDQPLRARYLGIEMRARWCEGEAVILGAPAGGSSRLR